MAKARKEVINNVSNDAAVDIATPYIANVEIVGTTGFLFHRWSCDAVEEKMNSLKNSKAKKTDNIESYVYRTEKGELAIPGEYLRQALIHAAKFRQDPRSPRKSAMDLFKAGVVSLTELAPLGVKDWDMLDRRRVVIHGSAITRERPAMRKGWKIRVQIQVLLPEYITPDLLSDVLTSAGKLIGIGDFRPTFGRFRVTKFEVVPDDAEAAAAE